MPGCTTPVVIAVEPDGRDRDRQGAETGADDYVTKPFGMNELGARIGVALRHRLQQQGERAIFQTGGADNGSRQAHRQSGRNRG